MSYLGPKHFERLKKRRIQAQNVLRDGRNVVSGLPKDEKKALPGDAGCFSSHFISFSFIHCHDLA